MRIIAEHAFVDNWQNFATSTKTVILLEILVAKLMGTPNKMLGNSNFQFCEIPENPYGTCIFCRSGGGGGGARGRGGGGNREQPSSWTLNVAGANLIACSAAPGWPQPIAAPSVRR